MSTNGHPQQRELPTRVMGGYFAALLASSAALPLLPIVWNLIVNFAAIVHRPSLLIGSDNSHFSIALYFILPFAFVFVIIMTSIFAFFFTIVPTFIFGFIYIYFNIRHVAYFLIAGALMGFLITVLFSHAALFSQGELASWEYMCSCGAIGGLTYWYVAVRQPRRKYGTLVESA